MTQRDGGHRGARSHCSRVRGAAQNVSVSSALSLSTHARWLGPGTWHMLSDSGTLWVAQLFET